MSPHDWSPRGWRVDQEELAFIREAHKVQARRVMLEEVESFGLDWEKGRGEKKKDLSEQQEGSTDVKFVKYERT